jgi:predicted HicB family RNase H-like nuclease
MTSFPVNLPTQLQQEAQRWAANQGMSLEQFIIWAIALQESKQVKYGRRISTGTIECR